MEQKKSDKEVARLLRRWAMDVANRLRWREAFSASEAVRQAYKVQNCLEALGAGKVKLTYMKKNGEIREAVGTLCKGISAAYDNYEYKEQPGEATYTVHVVDQNGDPVPEAAVGFCVDTGCMPIEADENGVASYTGAPTRYHLKVVDAPDEYDYPDDTDIYIGPESGEQTLVITKEE